MKICLRADDGHAPESVRSYCLSVLNQIDDLNVMTVFKPSYKKRSLITLYEQQICGLDSLPDNYIFSVENDVLYHPSRFEFNPPVDDIFYYQSNFYNLTPHGYLKHGTGIVYSQLVAKNCLWKENIQARIKAWVGGQRLAWAEPGYGDPNSTKNNVQLYRSEFPDVGIRHGKNMTGGRHSNNPDSYIDTIPYWGNYRELWDKLGMNSKPRPVHQECKKLNVGSGCMLLQGYVNFDAVKVVRGDKQTNVVGDARNLGDYFEPESFDEIICYHLLEHLKPKEGKKVLLDCHKLLEPGGRIIVETPDILGLIILWNEKHHIFGNPPSISKMITYLFGWDVDQWKELGFHQYGYTVDTMAEVMAECGFEIIHKGIGMSHGMGKRDLRVEGIKK